MKIKQKGCNIFCSRTELDDDGDEENIVVAVVSSNSKKIGEISSEITNILTDREKSELSSYLTDYSKKRRIKVKSNHFNHHTDAIFKICERVLVDMDEHLDTHSVYIDQEKIDMQCLVDIYILLKKIFIRNDEMGDLFDLYYHGKEGEEESFYEL